MTRFLCGVMFVVAVALAGVAFAGHITLFSGAFIKGPNSQCVVLVVDAACIINNGPTVTEQEFNECLSFCSNSRTGGVK